MPIQNLRFSVTRLCPLALTTLLILALGLEGEARLRAIQAAPASDRFAAIDAFVADQMAAYRVPGLALAVVEGDRPVHVVGFGQAAPDGSPVSARTRFRIGSNTKSMTALAIMQLAERGAVSLDDPVRRYLPWFDVADAGAGGAITVRELLHQTSGLPNSANAETFTDTGLTLEENVRRLNRVHLDRPVGSSFEYANLNYDVLGLIVETAAHEPYDAYVHAHIFEPLAMSDTTAGASEEARDGLMAAPYKWWFGWPRPGADPFSRAHLPAGYVSSTAQDMARYVIAQMNEGRDAEAPVLSTAGFEAMHAPEVTSTVPTEGNLTASYAMGWVAGRLNGRRFLTHTGATMAFASEQLIDQDARIGVVVLTNSEEQYTSDVAVRTIAAGVLRRDGGLDLPPTASPIPGRYLTIDAVVALLTLLILTDAARVTRRFWRARDGHASAPRGGMVTGLMGAVAPILVLATVPQWLGDPWPLLLLGAPDLGWWAIGAAGILSATGVLRLALARRAAAPAGRTVAASV